MSNLPGKITDPHLSAEEPLTFRRCLRFILQALLLVGYDDENYWFNDPWHDHGVCPQPKQLVEECHAAQGLFAVTLRPKGEA